MSGVLLFSFRFLYPPFSEQMLMLHRMIPYHSICPFVLIPSYTIQPYTIHDSIEKLPSGQLLVEMRDSESGRVGQAKLSLRVSILFNPDRIQPNHMPNTNSHTSSLTKTKSNQTELFSHTCTTHHTDLQRRLRHCRVRHRAQRRHLGSQPRGCWAGGQRQVSTLLLCVCACTNDIGVCTCVRETKCG